MRRDEDVRCQSSKQEHCLGSTIIHAGCVLGFWILGERALNLKESEIVESCQVYFSNLLCAD